MSDSEHGRAKVYPVWKVKHTVGKPENMVPHSLYNKVADENVEMVKEIVRLESQLAGAAADAEVLARAVSAHLAHPVEQALARWIGHTPPLADALTAYLEKHPWSEL